MSSITPIYPMNVINPLDERAISTAEAYIGRDAGQSIGHGTATAGLPWSGGLVPASVLAWQHNGAFWPGKRPPGTHPPHHLLSPGCTTEATVKDRLPHAVLRHGVGCALRHRTASNAALIRRRCDYPLPGAAPARLGIMLPRIAGPLALGLYLWAQRTQAECVRRTVRDTSSDRLKRYIGPRDQAGAGRTGS